VRAKAAPTGPGRLERHVSPGRARRGALP